MVGSVGSNYSMIQQQMSQSTNSSNNSLSTSQKETIASVLEQFDATNLTSSDASSIVSAFEEAGIEPGKALESALSEAGFDAKEIGDLASKGGPSGGGGMPPPPSEQEQSDVSDMLDSLLSLGEDEDEDSTSASFDEVMDYTSRILNLNEQSKTSVMEILEEYSSGESDYSQDEISNIVKNSLSSILSDPDNYNHISVYA